MLFFDTNNQAVINDGSLFWIMLAQATIKSLTLSPGATAIDANNNGVSNGSMAYIILERVNNEVVLAVTAEDMVTSSNYTIT